MKPRFGATSNDEVCDGEDFRSLTCRHCIVCVSAWSANALASSIKSVPSCWSAASQYVKGQRLLRTELPRILATPPDSLLTLRVIEALTEDWRRLDQRIDELSSEIEELANYDPTCVG
jgi:hypothetical protein